MNEPTTQAGRALVKHLYEVIVEPEHAVAADVARRAIPAIEQEAVANFKRELAATPEPTLDALASKMADRLAKVYRRDGMGFAELCDEQIDRSGNLLGWLREYARLSQPTQEPS